MSGTICSSEGATQPNVKEPKGPKASLRRLAAPAGAEGARLRRAGDGGAVPLEPSSLRLFGVGVQGNQKNH